jgi:gamma-glutamylcysteine synthetase
LFFVDLFFTIQNAVTARHITPTTTDAIIANSTFEGSDLEVIFAVVELLVGDVDGLRVGVLDGLKLNGPSIFSGNFTAVNALSL